MDLPGLAVLSSFAVVAGVLTLTPGVDTALVLRTAATAGPARARGVVVGVQCGTLLWGALAAVGVGALLAASQVAYDVVRFLGAAYLLWVGVRLLWSAVRGDDVTAPDVGLAQDRFWPGWRQGALTNVLNPKVGAFYVALLPQLVPDDAPHLVWGLALAGVHVVLGSLWLGTLAALARTMRRRLARRTVRRAVDGVAGAVVTAFGVRLATSPH